jgi:hypothetical protein
MEVGADIFCAYAYGGRSCFSPLGFVFPRIGIVTWNKSTNQINLNFLLARLDRGARAA